MDRLRSIHRECTAIATALYDVCVRACIINLKKWKLYDESDKNYAERKKPNICGYQSASYSIELVTVQCTPQALDAIKSPLN